MAENDNKDQEKPKIVVDDDWKAAAKAEKEKLAHEVERKADTNSAEAGEGQPKHEQRQLPPASFAALITSLVTQAYIALGGYEDPKTKRRYVDLDLAKFHIDTLAVLEQRTKGNLTDEEAKLLDQALYETRMQYVQLAQHLSS